MHWTGDAPLWSRCHRWHDRTKHQKPQPGDSYNYSKEQSRTFIRLYKDRIPRARWTWTSPSRDVQWLNLQFAFLKWEWFLSCCYEDEVELSPCILLKCCCLLRGLGGFLSPVEDKQEDIFREKTSRNSPHIQSSHCLFVFKTFNVTCRHNVWDHACSKRFNFLK